MPTGRRSRTQGGRKVETRCPERTERPRWQSRRQLRVDVPEKRGWNGRARAKTMRTTGRSLERVIDDLNPTLRGWFGYFQHSRARTFGPLDGWIRRRLRSLLRKQQKLKGVADVRGADQTRWPNRFFAEHGLLSLQAAYGAVRQSPCG